MPYIPCRPAFHRATAVAFLSKFPVLGFLWSIVTATYKLFVRVAGGKLLFNLESSMPQELRIVVAAAARITIRFIYCA